MVERFFAFIGRHPRSFDAVVAIFWGLLSLTERESGDVGTVLVLPAIALMTIALFWRRRFPLQVFSLHAVLVIMLTIADVDDSVPIAIMCGTYSLAAHIADRRMSISAFVTFVITGLATVLITSPQYVSDTLVIALLLGIAWVIGDSLRTRRAYQQSVLERAERAEALRDSMALQAVAEERTRIARDLHDVVAHSMSLMVVQAGAARRVVNSNPDASIAALQAIETVGRNSLDEMRRILGVLRGEEGGADMAPQPDIAAIDTMVDEFQAAGLPVKVSKSGTERPLSPSLELTAFRIVQESLTNTLKHAGPAAATVSLDYQDETLHIVVEDNGRGASQTVAPEPGSQKGHVGMRERVASFGGMFTARPRLDGGYHVSATLPIAAITLSEGVS